MTGDELPASPLIETAGRFAREAHRGRRRHGDTEFEHPLAVARLLHGAGRREEVVAAGLLHDVVEDTDASLDELRERFGDPVAELVAAMTEDPGREPYETRKAEHRERVRAAGPEVAAIYLADKLATAREHARRCEPMPAAKLAHYRETLRVLAAAYPDDAFVPELRAALAQVQPAAHADARR